MYDVAIIGAGVIGSAIARELSRFKLKILVLEKETDVASGTSKANSGIVHAGFDAEPDSLKARYNIAGQKMFDALSEELDFPFKRCGSIVAAFSSDELPKLEELKTQGENNGLNDLKIIGRDELLELEPNMGKKAIGALFAPSGGIVCPYEMTIAFAENAAENGVEFLFECPVENAVKTKDGFLLKTGLGEFNTKILINAAGLFSDQVNNWLSENKIKIIPRKGEYCLFDKTEGALVGHTLFQLPTKMGKGVLLSPTVDGNLLAGPTSTDIEDKANVATTREGLEEVLAKSRLYTGGLPLSKIITAFAGLRAHSITDDFIIGEAEDVKGLINVSGIESPGLTSAPAIAKHVAGLAAEMTAADKNESFKPRRKGIPRFRHMSTDERKALIAKSPDYGQIVCRCETVTKGEILDAMRAPLGAKNLDSVKRRTRMGMGRCQAGFCSMRVLDIVSEELGIPIDQVTKFGGNTRLLIEKNKATI